MLQVRGAGAASVRALACMLAFLLVVPPAGAQAPAGDKPVSEAPPAAPAAPTGLDTPAQSLVRKLPASALKTTPPRRFNSGDYINPRTAIVLDEIRVYGQVEPEDYVGRKKSPIAQFGDRLARDRPMTPAEKVGMALCFIGMCPGLPPEVAPEQRTEARVNQTTTQLNSQFRGTLQ